MRMIDPPFAERYFPFYEHFLSLVPHIGNYTIFVVQPLKITKRHRHDDDLAAGEIWVVTPCHDARFSTDGHHAVLLIHQHQNIFLALFGSHDNLSPRRARLLSGGRAVGRAHRFGIHPCSHSGNPYHERGSREPSQTGNIKQCFAQRVSGPLRACERHGVLPGRQLRWIGVASR